MSKHKNPNPDELDSAFKKLLPGFVFWVLVFMLTIIVLGLKVVLK